MEQQELGQATASFSQLRCLGCCATAAERKGHFENKPAEHRQDARSQLVHLLVEVLEGAGDAQLRKTHSTHCSR